MKRHSGDKHAFKSFNLSSAVYTNYIYEVKNIFVFSHILKCSAKRGLSLGMGVLGKSRDEAIDNPGSPRTWHLAAETSEKSREAVTVVISLFRGLI